MTWNVKTHTPHGWDNPFLLGGHGGEPLLNAKLPDNDQLVVVNRETGPAGQLSFALTTDSGNWWRAIEVYDISAIRFENEGDPDPNKLHRPLEIHTGPLLDVIESENGSVSGPMHFSPGNRVLVFRKAKLLGVRTVMYIALAMLLPGLETGPFYTLRWRDW